MASNPHRSLDTNAILRLAIGDIPEQRAKVLSLLNDSSQIYHICSLVTAEVVFNLQIQKYTRDSIANFLTDLLEQPNIIDNSGIITDVLKLYKTHPALSFVDCYTAIYAQTKSQSPLYTFDQKLAHQHPSAKLIK